MTEPTVHVPAAAEPAPAPPRRVPKDALWIVLPAGGGILLGALWWILAPGGLNLVSGNPALADANNPASWLPRDLVLAGLVLLAGCFTGLMLDGKLQGPSVGRRLTLALLGGALGGIVAWLVGLLSAQLFGPAPDPALGPGYGFTLRSYAVLLLWPAATAFITFVLALFGVLSKKPVK
ncbi:hypothetical protein J2790_004294 [Paenarthrobacter nicotinovorans]|uniref:hypothetical protein n=1 Tax=Micrococcaceae TaxID=1268 RepID=UPI000B853210|nr:MULTISPECIES: hypothetical protein [Micrococcaceae]MDR6439119.1 hypothetical protein [Paenarthrobacter nicotinovorans]